MTIFFSVSGILCHHCLDNPKSSQTCEDVDAVIDCGKDPEFGDYYSSCYTLTLNFTFGNTTYVIRDKNCSVSDEEHCSMAENQTCSTYYNHISIYGRLNSCKMQCCSKNYCNNGRVLPTQKPDITKEPALAYSNSQTTNFGNIVSIPTTAQKPESTQTSALAYSNSQTTCCGNAVFILTTAFMLCLHLYYPRVL